MADYTLTSSVGAFTLTGIAVDFIHDAVLDAGTGAHTYTGIAAGLVHGYTMEADAGAFVQTGIAASLVHGYPLSSSVGSFIVNLESAGFGSFVQSIPKAILYVQVADDRYLTSGGAYVTIDLLEGSSYSRSTSQEYSVTRTAIVQELNSGNNMDTAQINQAAIDAVSELTGELGSSLTTIETPTYLERFVPELLDQHTVKLKIMYRSYPLPEYEFDSSLGQIETNIDSYGDSIEVGYTYPDDYKIDSRKAGLTIKQGGLVSMPIGETTITVHFTVTSGTFPVVVYVNDIPIVAPAQMSATDIMTQLQLYTGCVNAGSYSVGRISGGPRTWIVERVRGRSRDGGRTFQASFTLRYKPQGIEQQVTFINSDDGLPPSDLVYWNSISGYGYYTPHVAYRCDIPSFLFNNPNYWTQGQDWIWQ